jgi:cell division protease FtsH
MGPLSYGKKEEQIFLGREIATHKDYSEDTAVKIDEEVCLIVTDGYEKAKNLLSDNMDILHKIAAELLEKEVLNMAELDAIIGLQPPPPVGMPPVGMPGEKTVAESPSAE